MHDANDCGVAFAAWKGFDSPLRHGSTVGSCRQGGHRLWWQVQATSPEAALALLPPFVSQRTEVVEVAELAIP